jgi:hypothetical protein
MVAEALLSFAVMTRGVKHVYAFIAGYTDSIIVSIPCARNDLPTVGSQIRRLSIGKHNEINFDAPAGDIAYPHVPKAIFKRNAVTGSCEVANFASCLGVGYATEKVPAKLMSVLSSI